MATKLVRMVIYLDRLLTIKSYKALIMWSSKVTWQTKTIISLLQGVYGNQIWQNDSFPWWTPTYNVAWPFDHMALWDRRFTYKSRFSTQTLKSSPTSCFRCRRVMMTNKIIGSLEPWQLKNKFKGIFFLLIKKNKHDKQTNTRKLKLLVQGRCSAKIIFQSLTALKLLSNTFGKHMLRANMDSRTTLMNFFLRSFWSIFQIYLNTGKQLYLQMQT